MVRTKHTGLGSDPAAIISAGALSRPGLPKSVCIGQQPKPLPCVPLLLHWLRLAANEAGLLYVCEPCAPVGMLAAMTRRHLPAATGDGMRSGAALIAADPRCRHHAVDYAAALGLAALARGPDPTSSVALTTITSLRIGARYEDIPLQATTQLSATLDAIVRSIGDIRDGYLGVKLESVAASKEGRFAIIEVNCAGSKAIQFWDPALRLAAAFRNVLAKQRQILGLGGAMRRAGHMPVGPIALARNWLRQQVRLPR